MSEENIGGLGGMRAWEPEPGEVTQTNQAKPWNAFKTYRDLGPQRTLRVVTEIIYGAQITPEMTEEEKRNKLSSGMRQVERWSSKFDWVERVEAFDDWLSMRDRATIENWRNKRATEFFERQKRIQERLLDNAEKFVDQADKMLDWPLVEQRSMDTDEDGNVRTLIFVPAHWSKATAATYQNLAAAAVTGHWSSARPGEVDDPAADLNLEQWTDQDLQNYLQLMQKARPGGPTDAPNGR